VVSINVILGIVVSVIIFPKRKINFLIEKKKRFQKKNNEK
jgi:hypothetical protein